MVDGLMQMEPNQLGVRAVDDFTLEVELSVPVSYFDQLLYFCTFYPANQKFVEKCGDKYATSPETCLANGAFILTEYSPDGTSISFIKNTAYYNANQVKLGGVHYEIIPSAEDSLKKYQEGKLDLVELAGDAVEQMKNSPDFRPESLMPENQVRGSALVADEIRKLSETSSKSFSTVKSSISQTQQLVTQIQEAMEEQQEGSKQIYRDTGNTLSEIANSVESAVGQIGDQIDLFTV